MATTFPSSLGAYVLSCLFFFHIASAYIAKATVSSTILIFARDTTSAEHGAAAGLRGYGIPYQIVTVPQAGLPNLPVLNSSTTYGNYGGIVVLSEVGYNYDNLYHSALTTKQWNDLYSYQTNFGARMVRLDVFPTAEFGVTSIGSTLNDEPVSFTNVTGFESANYKMNVGVSIANIFHSPARITDPTIAWEVARFGSTGTAAVVNKIGARQQMVWFMPFALDWSASGNILQHAWITWITRGLYVGFRRIYFSTQVDDMFLTTDMYRPQGQEYRTVPDDLATHVSWQTALNARMPTGSQFFIEIGHNGNGDIATAAGTGLGPSKCNPRTAIQYDRQPVVPQEYKKPLGTGTNIWPATPTKYSWSLECAKLDLLENWFAITSNRDAFGHISHTFTHPVLTNATYSDASKEISFNQAWLKQVGLDAGKWYSGKGIIPPAITGLHNGDAIKAWMDNGIVHVVGDNTRPLLRNQQNDFWPLTTTVENNGYAGLNVIPRWATLIYYNCDLPACTLQEWIDTSAGSGTFDDLITNARDTAMRNLFGLHWDPYMFHQANMRVHDVPMTTVNGKSGRYSLLMTWIEVVTSEMMRLTTWPLKTLKHDDLGAAFIARQTRDLCRPSMTWTISANGANIDSVNVYTAGGNRCGTTIPITVPSAVSSSTGATKEQLGSDPLTLWVKMSGASRSYKFSTPVRL